jgi:hypothetical protein
MFRTSTIIRNEDKLPVPNQKHIKNACNERIKEEAEEGKGKLSRLA